MRILVCTHHYRTEPIGIGAYTGDLCEWLSRRGHEVRVIAPPPHYPEWRVRRPYRSWRYGAERLAGVSIRRCPLWVPSNPRSWSRFISQVLFAATSLPVVLAEMWRRPDIVLVVEPAFVDVMLVAMVARLFNKACWLHIQDFEIDVAFELGHFHHKGLRQVAHQCESWVMRQFDVVSTISEGMRRKVEAKGVAASKAVLFPNWGNTETIFPFPGVSPLRRELGLSPDTIIALFSGTLGTKQGLDVLIETAVLLRDSKHIQIVICGNGPAAEALRLKTKEMENVRLFPLQPTERLNDLLNIADIHLLPQKSEVADLVMPSKLINMLASGRPIVSTVRRGTEIERVVSQCGLAVEPDNATAMARAIQYLSQNVQERLRLGAAARQYALDHLRDERILGRFEETLRDTVFA